MMQYGPKSADHPSVGKACPVCGVLFREGDFTTLEPTHAANPREARKAQAGEPYLMAAVEVHWD